MRKENTNNLLKFLRSLKVQEDTQKGFTPDSIAQETNYAPSTIKKYLSAFLREYCFYSYKEKLWYCSGLSELTDFDFLTLMSQNKGSDFLNDTEKFIHNLYQKSKNSFLTALQLYNSPNQPSRIELFAMLIANSWELLLKGEIVQTNALEAIYKKNKSQTISCRDALKKQYPEHSNIRKNIEEILNIRDQAVHLAINEIQYDLCRLFQSTILNYVKKYNQITGGTPLPSMNSGLLNLIIEGNAVSTNILKQRYGEASADIVQKFLGKLRNQSNKINSPEFAISMDYKLCLTKNESASDITLHSGDTGEKAIRIYEPVDPTRSHPYKTFDARDAINGRIRPKMITNHIFYKIVRKYKIKSNRDYFYLNESTPRYSEKFIEWCSNNINNQVGWLENI
ncbi:DUF3644 domain-containing protein [Legionella israelensis]|uniref:DUF3644 domain-containing protein n=1 Tax=Legionella israelensis TaxID=454 RepID=A0A0W0V2L6_9GAMM|nr:DUF3644 domain-containing protein [Legionella israelensis]KTD14314.1 hypothetical protein Lisr_2542 [Legionella israelensis]QBS10531.1 DUF3644 domain-containing protein [Legionella israelensis]SCX94550.1 Protein of unknown function [Legionella israelensis DSM 19235]